MEKVGGIIFFRTGMLQTLKDFYLNRMGMDIWLDQGGCIIFRRSNLLLGFCEQQEELSPKGMITFFYPTRDEVDRAYDELMDIATSKPEENIPYKIYQFFAVDPEGRDLEFQAFLHPIDWTF